MRVIDSHTEGEPTRVVISGGPELEGATLTERVNDFRRRFDDVRRALILEPRGSDAMVGALLCPPVDPDCDTGVIFFNNTGYLGMCGHGSIGVAVTLAWLGRDIGETLRLETPVGVVNVKMNGSNEATVDNVPSFVLSQDIEVSIDGYPPITGDVAWGGNWFFLADWPHSAIEPGNIPELISITRQIKARLARDNVTGRDGAEIDHVELFAHSDLADSRSFVLCPGGAWDRSPCGTGTSAKLACLAARGKLGVGESWVQESVTGGLFTASYREGVDNTILPSITGHAWITADTKILRLEDDPFRSGIGGVPTP